MVKTLYSYNLYSHPEKLLKKHLVNVKDIGINVFEKENLERILNKDVLKAILLFHDFGKASSYFQDKLFQRKRQNVNLTYHSDISALSCLFYLELRGFSIIDMSIAFLVIKKHHGNLNLNIDDLFRIDDDRKEYLVKIFDAIDSEEIFAIYQKELQIHGFGDYIKEKIRDYSIRRYRNAFKKELTKDFIIYTQLNLYFSILVFSDKQECLFERFLLEAGEIEFDQYSIVDRFKESNFKNKNNSINIIREKAYSEVESELDVAFSIFSINLPTGAGKTLTALNAAMKLLNKDKTLTRIIYCLPFTSVIDQNAQVFQTVLNDFDNALMLKHHHLSEMDYSSTFYKEEFFTDNQAENLIETWESKIVVTTFYQFMHTLFSGNNRILKKFNKINNSIIILDEVQSIPRKYWLLINHFFKFLKSFFNIKVILMTATMPMIFSEENNEIKELAKSKKQYFSFFNRIVLDVSLSHDESVMDISGFADILLREFEKNSNKSFLIILNTIKSSLELYEILKQAGYEIIYLSSNVIPKERLDRIHKIKDRKDRSITISTQIVEAGVDIDFDIVYRDFAPLDSIFQACGRCNRNGVKDEKGIVNIVRLIDDKQQEFSRFIYDDVNLSKTMYLFKNKKIIEEKDFFDLSHQYFEQMKKVTEEYTSLSIINAIQNLDYKTAFYDDNSFKLIDDSFKTISVFFELDNGAAELLSQYRILLENENSFEKNVQLKNIFRKMSHYMINVAEKYMTNPDDSSMIIIEQDDVPKYYSPQTGFIRSESTPDYFF